MPAHMFFSCSEAPEDRAFLGKLLTHLEPKRRSRLLSTWHQAQPGEDAVSVRRRQLDRADLFVLIVSEDANASEICSQDVHMAFRAGKKIIPVLFRSCLYQDSPYGNLQPVPGPSLFISGSERMEQLITVVAEALVSEARSIPPPPPGLAYSPRFYVSRPVEENQGHAYLQHQGLPVVLFAPKHSGKTWLLEALLDHVEQEDLDCSVIRLNLDRLEEKHRRTYAAFIAGIEDQLHSYMLAHHPKLAPFPAAPPGVSAATSLTWFMEQAVLPATRPGARVYLAVDQADVKWSAPFWNDFFRLLRAWSQTGSRSDTIAQRWSILRLLLAIATPPTELVTNIYQSPFDLCEPITLQAFSLAQTRELAEQYGFTPSNCTDADLLGIRERVALMPHPLRRFFFHARRSARPMTECILNYQGDRSEDV